MKSEASKDASTTIQLSTEKVATGPRPQLPSSISILAMLRGTLLAVDHGIKTGNYTVLRDLGATSFRKANSAAKLAQIFGNLSSQGLDLLATAVVDPNFTKPPIITPERMIYLTGIFPIQPRPVAFEILLELDEGQWRIYAIAIAPAAN